VTGTKTKARKTGPRAKRASERSRQPTEIRRQLIVEAARGVIVERGLFATTMRDIALGSEVSLGTVTYHFTGIGEILAEVVQGEMDSFYAPIAELAAGAPDAMTSLQAIVEGLFASDHRTREHWLLWLDFWALASHYPKYSEWQSEVYARWEGDVTRLLEQGRAEGVFHIQDPEREAIIFMALLDGLVVQSYLPGARLTPAQSRDYLYAHVSRALAAPAGPTLSTTPARSRLPTDVS